MRSTFDPPTVLLHTVTNFAALSDVLRKYRRTNAVSQLVPGVWRYKAGQFDIEIHVPAEAGAVRHHLTQYQKQSVSLTMTKLGLAELDKYTYRYRRADGVLLHAGDRGFCDLPYKDNVQALILRFNHNGRWVHVWTRGGVFWICVNEFRQV